MPYELSIMERETDYEGLRTIKNDGIPKRPDRPCYWHGCCNRNRWPVCNCIRTAFQGTVSYQRDLRCSFCNEWKNKRSQRWNANELRWNSQYHASLRWKSRWIGIPWCRCIWCTAAIRCIHAFGSAGEKLQPGKTALCSRYWGNHKYCYSYFTIPWYYQSNCVGMACRKWFWRQS